MRIKARAIRQCGVLLKEIEPARGGDRRSEDFKSGDAPTFETGRQAAAEQAGMSKDQAVTAIRVANVPAEEFEAAVESDAPPTITGAGPSA